MSEIQHFYLNRQGCSSYLYRAQSHRDSSLLAGPMFFTEAPTPTTRPTFSSPAKTRETSSESTSTRPATLTATVMSMSSLARTAMTTSRAAPTSRMAGPTLTTSPTYSSLESTSEITSETTSPTPETSTAMETMTSSFPRGATGTISKEGSTCSSEAAGLTPTSS